MKPFAALAGTMKETKTKEGLKTILKTKNIPEDWADDVHVGENYDENEVATRLEAKWNSAKQTAVNQSIGDGSVIKGNAGSSTSIEEAIKDFGKTTTAKDAGYNVVESI